MDWLRPERLALLRELAERGTLRAVADARGYTPSAVSQQLARLQRDAGVPLLEPAGRVLRLTAAGELLAARAAEVLDLLERAACELQALDGRVVGRVGVAMFQTASLSLGVRLLLTLRHEHPQLAVELVDQDPERSLPALALGAVDVVVAQEYENLRRSPDPRWTRVHLLDEPVHIAVPAEHPLAVEGRDRVELRELGGQVWAAGHADTAFGQLLERACASVGFRPDIRFRSNDHAVLGALVAAGEAAALVPGLALQAPPSSLHLLTAADVELGRKVFVATREGSMSPAVRQVVDHVRAIAAEAAASTGL